METIFSVESADNIKALLQIGLKFPFVSVRLSTLGGRERASLMVTISAQSREAWPNGILENSSYSHISIERDGVVENFSGNKMKLRGFKGRDIAQIIEKINKIKVA